MPHHAQLLDDDLKILRLQATCAAKMVYSSNSKRFASDGLVHLYATALVREVNVRLLVLAAMHCPSARYRPRPRTDPPSDPLSERAGEEDGLLMKTSRALTFAGGTAAFSFLMHVLNK